MVRREILRQSSKWLLKQRLVVKFNQGATVTEQEISNVWAAFDYECQMLEYAVALLQTETAYGDRPSRSMETECAILHCVALTEFLLNWGNGLLGDILPPHYDPPSRCELDTFYNNVHLDDDKDKVCLLMRNKVFSITPRRNPDGEDYSELLSPWVALIRECVAEVNGERARRSAS